MSDVLLLCITLVLVTVALTARSHGTFAGAWLLALGGAAFLERDVLALAGIILLGPGLLGIRVVLRRSVSVSMLAGARAPDARIESRIDELERLRLARSTARGLELTTFGHAVAAFMHALYLVLGHRR